MPFGETPCDIYSCRNKQVKMTDVTVTIDGITEQIEVCDEHKAFFETFDAQHYAIGKTYTGLVEVRPVPSLPALPREAPPEA